MPFQFEATGDPSLPIPIPELKEFIWGENVSHLTKIQSHSHQNSTITNKQKKKKMKILPSNIIL